MSDSTTLDPLYYLSNFRTALRWVLTRYADLMSASEQTLCEDFLALPTPCQALLVRLISRKGIHFRLNKLSYPEIGSLDAIVLELCQKNWLEEDASVALEQVLELLLKAEISLHLPQTGLSASAKKADVAYALQQQNLPARRFSQWCPNLNDRLVTVKVSAWADLVRLLFFGNLAQQWSEFVLADLGVFRYEKVAFTQDSRGFHHRQDIEDYLTLRALREQFYQGAALAQVLPQVLAFSSSSALLKRRQQKLFEAMAKAYELADDPDTALSLYQRCVSVQARWRQVRILENKGCDQAAYQLAHAFANSPINEEESLRLERALTRLSKKLSLGLSAKKRFYESRFDLTLPLGRCVELAVRDHLSTPEAPVYYVENALFVSLFGLLCWDAIFAPIPGAFFHPFHSGPTDLYHEDFVSKRQARFNACLNALDDGSYGARIRSVIQEKFGLQSPFVCWGLLDEALIELALQSISPMALKAIFLRLLNDLKNNRTGMPDLIQFYPASNSFRLIEVKGPGDRLQDNQKRWLAFAAQTGITVDVCYVHWNRDDV